MINYEQAKKIRKVIDRACRKENQERQKPGNGLSPLIRAEAPSSGMVQQVVNTYLEMSKAGKL